MRLPSFSTILALYGSAVATLSVAWHIRRDIRDRGDLRADFHLLGEDGARPFIEWRITNHGTHPLALAHVGCVVQKRLSRQVVYLDGMESHNELPCKLDVGQTVVLQTSLRWPEGTRCLAAWDTKGRCYRMPRDRFELVQRDVARQKRIDAGDL